MLNDIQIIELFDKYHLGKANTEEQQQVKELIDGNANLVEVFNFRRSIVSAVRQNKKEELHNRFKVLTREVEEERQADKGRVMPVRWLWAAAAVATVVLGVLYFLNDDGIENKIANNPDSLKVIRKDSVIKEIVPQQSVQPQLAEEKKPAKDDRKTFHGVVELPYFETANGALGFGKNDRPVDRVIAVFERADNAGYNYGDTLKIFLPELPIDNGAWKVVYDKSIGLYHLTDGTRKFALHRDRGYQTLPND